MCFLKRCRAGQEEREKMKVKLLDAMKWENDVGSRKEDEYKQETEEGASVDITAYCFKFHSQWIT